MSDLDFVQKAVKLCADEFEAKAKELVHAVASTARDHANARQSLMDQRDELQAELSKLKAVAGEMERALEDVLPGKLIGESYEPPVPDDELLREYFFTWGKLRQCRAARLSYRALKG